MDELDDTAGCLRCGDATNTHTTETGCTRRTAEPVGCVLCLREIGWCMCDRKTCQQPHARPVGDNTVHGYQLCTRHKLFAKRLTPDELQALVHRTNTPRKAT